MDKREGVRTTTSMTRRDEEGLREPCNKGGVLKVETSSRVV